MKMYENMETGEVMTLIEVREHFYGFAKENPKAYDDMSFNEFLNNATGKNGSLKEITTRFLVVGHECEFARGELIYQIFDTREDAYNFIHNELDGFEARITTQCNIVRYATEDDMRVYEVWEIGPEPYILVDWHDGIDTSFSIAAFYVESDAYRAVIDDMQSFLVANDNEETRVWFGNDTGEIDYGDDLYRWNFIHNYT